MEYDGIFGAEGISGGVGMDVSGGVGTVGAVGISGGVGTSIAPTIDTCDSKSVPVNTLASICRIVFFIYFPQYVKSAGVRRVLR